MPSIRPAGFLFAFGISVLVSSLAADSLDSIQDIQDLPGKTLADSVFTEPAPKPTSRTKPKAPPKSPAKNVRLKESKGSLVIYSDPPGALLVFNSVKQGPTPRKVPLTRKNNRIVLRMPGFVSYDAMIGKKTLSRALTITLKPVPMKHGKSQPRKALMRDLKTGRTTVPDETPTQAQQSAESLSSELSLMRVPEKTSSPVVYPSPPSTPAPEETLAPHATSKTATGMETETGLVFFSSSPAHADITVDGAATGKQTPVKIRLSQGIHHIEMQCDGLKGEEDDTVNPGKNRALHLQLQ